MDLNHEKIEALHHAICIGPVNTTAYMLWKYITNDAESLALNLYDNDGDKISASVYAQPIRNILGCRIHKRINCEHEFCINIL